MSHERQPEFQFVAKHLKLLERLASYLRVSRNSVESTLFPWVDAIIQSTESLLLLARRGRLRDGYVLARVVFETSVNACYLLAGGSHLVDKAWRHVKARSLRDLERDLEIGDVKFRLVADGAKEILGQEDSRKLLEEFTSKRGFEVSWSPETAKNRVAAVLKHFGRKQASYFVFGFLLYRHASEIAHGSLFGILYSYGATRPDWKLKRPSDLRAFRKDELRLVLLLVGGVLNALVRILSKQVHDRKTFQFAQRLDDRFRSARRS